MPYSRFMPPIACSVRSSPLAIASARALGRVFAIAARVRRRPISAVIFRSVVPGFFGIGSVEQLALARLGP